MNEFKVLPPGKSVTWLSPIDGNNKDDVMVRTGIPECKHSIIHAIFHAQSREYAQMSEENRAKSVQKFTDNLADKLDHKKWENATNSNNNSNNN